MTHELASVVIGSLYPCTLEILVGINLGQLNGGIQMRIKQENVPPDCKMPNTIVMVKIVQDEIISIRKATEEDIKGIFTK